jgi:hypothetical protein
MRTEKLEVSSGGIICNRHCYQTDRAISNDPFVV